MIRVKVFCDMCKREIDYDVDGVNTDFNSFCVVKFEHGLKKEKQLCVSCAVRVCNWIESKSKKENDKKL